MTGNKINNSSDINCSSTILIGLPFCKEEVCGSRSYCLKRKLDFTVMGSVVYWQFSNVQVKWQHITLFSIVLWLEMLVVIVS